MKNSQPHQTRFIPKLAAEIDVQVVPLVKAITEYGFTTISSCQGDPGAIDDVEHGHYGHVAFVDKEPFQHANIAKFLFEFLRSFFAHQYDDVRLELSLSEDAGFVGWLHFRNEVLDDISRRLAIWREGTYAK